MSQPVVKMIIILFKKQQLNLTFYLKWFNNLKKEQQHQQHT